MSPRSSVCSRIEPDLVAVASGEGEPGAALRVQEHLRHCAPCRDELEQYRAVERELAPLRVPQSGWAERAEAERAERCLLSLRRRFLLYGTFASPLGRILIGRTEEGVSVLGYLDDGEDAAVAHLARSSGLEPIRSSSDLEGLYAELLEYLSGAREHLEWRLDLRLARSEFHRRVLRATAGLPYGAVTSYAHIAQEIGRPTGVRAVAQALRRNPLPIVVPCHRVVGSSGSLTGYAGNKLGLKQKLLSIERVPVRKARGYLAIAREAMYVRDPDGREYCLPTCGSLSSMSLARLVLFASRRQAETSGLVPCGTCRPDVHPLH